MKAKSPKRVPWTEIQLGNGRGHQTFWRWRSCGLKYSSMVIFILFSPISVFNLPPPPLLDSVAMWHVSDVWNIINMNFWWILNKNIYQNSKPDQNGHCHPPGHAAVPGRMKRAETTRPLPSSGLLLLPRRRCCTINTNFIVRKNILIVIFSKNIHFLL